jgi:hypothetical protein
MGPGPAADRLPRQTRLRRRPSSEQFGWQMAAEGSEKWEQWGRMSRRVQIFPPIHLHHLTARDAGFATETEFCEARGSLTGRVSSYYHDGGRGLRHPNKFDFAVLASPFPCALVSFLFFHDASDPPHYPLTRMRQTQNVPVYASCVIVGVAPVTYEEQVRNEIEVRRECAQISSGSTWGRWPDTESVIDTLLPTPERL